MSAELEASWRSELWSPWFGKGVSKSRGELPGSGVALGKSSVEGLWEVSELSGDTQKPERPRTPRKAGVSTRIGHS